jgi:hypothetical protein
MQRLPAWPGCLERAARRRHPLDGRVMLARVVPACLAGVEAALVRIEVDVSQGARVRDSRPAGSGVRETRERVRTAIRNSGFAFPLERVTIDLPPPDVRQEGVSFDLARILWGVSVPRASRASLSAPGSSRLPPARRQRSPCRAIGHPSGRGSSS